MEAGKEIIIMSLDKNHLRIRNNAKVRPLNTPKDKLEYLQRMVTGKYLMDKTKHNLVKKITGHNCCMCDGIPEIELSFRVGKTQDSVRVLEYYCNQCLKAVYSREREYDNIQDIPSHYNCVKVDQIPHSS